MVILYQPLIFSILWRYFGWANQTTATVTLWVGAAFLYRNRKFHWLATIPAIFMTAVCSTFILNAGIGLGLDYQLSVWGGIIVAAVVALAFLTLLKPLTTDEGNES